MENIKTVDDIPEDIKEKMLKYQYINQDTLKDIYDDIACQYDKQMEICGFPDPKNITDILIKYGVPKDAPIIDLGCGTGLVGEMLRKHGFTEIVGIDASPEMLKKAEGRGYNRFIEAFLGINELPEGVEKNFNVAISSGLMCEGCSDDLIYDHLNVLKPRESEDDKLFFLFATRECWMEELGYNKILAELEEQGKCKLVEKFSWTRYGNLQNLDEPIGTFSTLEVQSFPKMNPMHKKRPRVKKTTLWEKCTP